MTTSITQQTAPAAHITALGESLSVLGLHPDIAAWLELPAPDGDRLRAAMQAHLDATCEAIRLASVPS